MANPNSPSGSASATGRGETADTRRDWEPIQEDTGADASTTARLKVANGWLYRSVVPGAGVGMVYVPDRIGG